MAVIFALLWGVHLEQGRNLIMVNLRAGGGGGTEQLKQLAMPEMPMPETRAPMPIERPVVASQSSETVAAAIHYVRSVAGGGIGIGRGGGIGSGYGHGVGAGFGGFIGGLRRSGLDVAIIVDGTGSMNLIIGDVKAKMWQLVLAIHRLVPTTRMAIVVYGGRGEPIQAEPLTLSPDKLLYFLNNIRAQNGGEWQEDTLGAVRMAVDRMGWRPQAKKVIILVGDTPPFDEDEEPTLEEIRKFRAENGIFNTVDVTVEEHERFVEQMVLDGRVSLNGRILHKLPVLVDPETDQVEVDGERVLVLVALDQEHHQKGDDGGAGVDGELPGVREVKHRTRGEPDHDRRARKRERAAAPGPRRHLAGESLERAADRMSAPGHGSLRANAKC